MKGFRGMDLIYNYSKLCISYNLNWESIFYKLIVYILWIIICLLELKYLGIYFSGELVIFEIINVFLD